MKYTFRSLCLLLFLCLNIHTGFAQGKKVEGIMMDESDNPLEAGSAVLLGSQDSVLVGFGVSDNKGRFRITDISNGRYILRLSYLGYQDNFIDLEISDSTGNVNLGSIKLTEGGIRLDEVTVKAYQVPIRIRHDTIEYNAAAFKTAPNADVEALLRKLPGIEVDKNGTIKAQGEKVDNVLVEGKEFFGNDPKMATKNLPADIVDKVQVFDKKSEMAEFSGIDDGQDQKTINLALKEGKKGGLFGKGTAGYGSKDRFDGKFNLNRFGKKSQFSAIGMANNTNDQGFSIMDYIDFMGGIGNLMGSGSGGGLRLSSDDIGIPLDGGLGQGFVNTKAGGINYNNDITDQTEVSGSYFYSHLTNDIQQTSLRRGLLPGQFYSTDGSMEYKSVTKGHNLNLNLKNKLDSTQWLTLMTSFMWNDGFNSSSSLGATRNSEDILQNQVISNNSSNSNRNRMSLNANYNKRFGKKSRIFSARFNFGNQNQENMGLVNSINRFNPDFAQEELIDTLNQEQFQLNDQMDYRFTMSYTEPLGKRRYLELNYSMQNYDNDFDKQFYDVLYAPDQRKVLNDILSNNYQRNYTYNRWGLNLKVNRKKYSISTGFKFQQSALDGQLGENLTPINKRFFNLLPVMNVTFDFTGSNNLRVDYFTNVREPSLEELQPTLDNSDPLNLYRGNPDLQSEYSHRLRLNYHSFSQFTNVAFFGSINGTLTKNKITNAQSIGDGFIQTIQPVNVDKEWLIDAYVGLQSPLNFIDLKISINGDIFYKNSILILNDLQNFVNRWDSSIDIKVENRKKENWDWALGFNILYNLTNYTENKELDADYTRLDYYADISLEMNKGWYFNTTMDYSIYSNEAFGSETKIPIWNASVIKNFLKGNRGQLKVAVIDLLDRNKGINRVSDLNYLQETRIQSLARYFLASFSYSFSGFNQKNAGVIHINNRSRR